MVSRRQVLFGIAFLGVAGCTPIGENEPPRQDYSNNSIHGQTSFWDIARRNFSCP